MEYTPSKIDEICTTFDTRAECNCKYPEDVDNYDYISAYAADIIRKQRRDLANNNRHVRDLVDVIWKRGEELVELNQKLTDAERKIAELGGK